MACLLVLVALPVMAEEANTNAQVGDLSVNVVVPETPSVSVTAPVSEAPEKVINTTKRLSYLIARGQNLINTRLNSLNSLKAKIVASKLTAEQKESLNAKIDDRIAKLTDLAAQIKVGTDIEAVRAQVKSIFTDYRIYAVFLPQISSDRNLYTLINYADKLLTDTVVKIQARIDAAKAKGKDVAAKQAALDNAKTKLPELKIKAQELIAKADALTPVDYPTNSKTVLAAVRTGIKEIRVQLNALNSTIRNARITVPKTKDK